MAVALIVAAGRGERLGSGRPKALVPLAGRPMLQWSVDALAQVREVSEIVVALPADELGAAPPGTTAVAGGAQRSHSVAAALAACAPAAGPRTADGTGTADRTDNDDRNDDELVIVHDAARPLAGADLFARVLAALRDAPGADAVIAAAPVTDTVKQVADDGRTVTATLARDRLWAVQTPQAFRRAALERVLGDGTDAELAAATDDASLIERAGGTVHVLAADGPNLKVTTPHDLRVAELIMSERAQARAGGERRAAAGGGHVR